VIQSAFKKVVLSEWTRANLAGVHLTLRDRTIAAALGESGRLTLLDLHDGVQVETRGWIGVVRLECCTIQVEPYLVDGHRNLVTLIDYVRGLSLLKRLNAAESFEARGETLFDLMAWLLTDACDGVLRAGVQADYVTQRDDLTMLRGRLDVRAQVLQRWGRVDRLVCDFEDRVRDIPENRWLLRALRAARRGVQSPRIEAMVRRATATWEELCEDNPGEALEKPVGTRTNHHYREALELAYLIIQGVTASDLLRSGTAGGFSFMLNMPRLFEEFVSSALQQVLTAPGVRVHRQAIDRSILWDVEGHRPFGHVRPDVMVLNDSQGSRLPVDAKYKDYDREKLQPGDVYQAAIYALAMSNEQGQAGGKRCLLIYPSGKGAEGGGRVQVRVGGRAEAEIVRLGIPVEALLDELGSARLGRASRRLAHACGNPQPELAGP